MASLSACGVKRSLKLPDQDKTAPALTAPAAETNPAPIEPSVQPPVPPAAVPGQPAVTSEPEGTPEPATPAREASPH